MTTSSLEWYRGLLERPISEFGNTWYFLDEDAKIAAFNSGAPGEKVKVKEVIRELDRRWHDHLDELFWAVDAAFHGRDESAVVELDMSEAEVSAVASTLAPVERGFFLSALRRCR